MFNSGKKSSASHDKKNNFPTLVLSEKKFLNETKNHNPPPFQVKWSVPYHLYLYCCTFTKVIQLNKPYLSFM